MTYSSRRQWIGQTSGALLAAGLWPGRLRAADNGKGGAFTFVALNDTHFMTPECPGWMERVMQSIQALPEKPEFGLLVGDLAQDGKQEELGPLKEILAAWDKPMHVVPGNHDYTKQGERDIYDQLFPGRLNYHFAHRDWQFVGLDSTEGVKFHSTSIQPGTLAWVDAHLPKIDRDKPLVLFTHFPLGEGVKYRPKNADALLDRFREHHLVTVLNGHYHAFTERTHNGATLTTNRCCAISRKNHDGSPEKGYFLCTLREGTLTRKFIEVKAG